MYFWKKLYILLLLRFNHLEKAIQILLNSELEDSVKSSIAQAKERLKVLRLEKASVSIVDFTNRMTLLKNSLRADIRKMKLISPHDRVVNLISTYGTVVLTIVSIVAITNPSFFNTHEYPKEFNLSTIVHGKIGIDNRVIVNSGEVCIILATGEVCAPINSNGESHFVDLPGKYFNQGFKIRVKHSDSYRLINPDSLYTLQNTLPIYLKVTLAGLDKIYATVKDGENELYLDSVLVSIRNLHIYTNELGYFELNIPDSLQRKNQKVSFFKAGYTAREFCDVLINSDQSVDIILEKIESQH
jgi:hypothetical protein